MEGRQAAELRMEQRRDHRAAPEQRAARLRSRSAHRGLGTQEAQALARERFPAFLRSPIGGLASGARVIEYLGDHWATVEVAGDEKLSMFSQLPMRAVQDGELLPVRLNLRSEPGGFRSANPLVAASFGDRAGDGVELTASGIALRPVGADDVAAELRDDRLFYANTETDADEILAPTPTGVQVLWQLRSDAAPSEYRLRFTMPEGAQLRLAEEFLTDLNAPFGPSQDGIVGAEIVRDGRSLTSIAPPATFDSDGERVPTRYSVDGDVLTVHVAHRGRDLAYPLLVDPEINDGGWNGAELGASGAWYANETLNGGPHNFSFSRNFQREGVQVGAYQWATYHEGATAGWNWQAPDGAYIREATFNNMRHIADNSSLITGIYRPGVWEAGPGWYGYDFTDYGWYHRAGSPTERNVAFMGLYMHGTSQRLRGAFASLSTVNLTVGDNYPPQTTLRARPSEAWTNNPWGAVGYDMTDRGLGIKAASVTRSGDERNASVIVNLSCTGIRQPCPLTHNTNGLGGNGYSQQLPYDLEALGEGAHPLHVRAQDVAGNVRFTDTDDDPATPWTNESQPVWYARYDKSGPTIALSGDLYNRRDQALTGDRYSFTVTATDGSAASASTSRSGVKRVDVYVDDVLVSPGTDQSCAAGNCGLTRQIELNSDHYPYEEDGEHLIRVQAVDQVGNVSAPSVFEIFINRNHREAPFTETDTGEAPPEGYGEAGVEDYCQGTDAALPAFCDADDPANPSRVDARQDPALIADYTDPLGSVFPVAAPVGTAAGSNHPAYGIAHYNSEFVNDPRFAALRVNQARIIVPFNMMIRPTTDRDNEDSKATFAKWHSDILAYNDSHDVDIKMTVSFSRQRGGNGGNYLPSKEKYREGVDKFIRIYGPNAQRAGGGVKFFTAWNEPNDGAQPTRGNAPRTADFYRELFNACKGQCTVAAAEFVDNDLLKFDYVDSYIKQIKATGPAPRYYAWHAYVAGKTGSTSRFRSFLRRIGSASIWLTEQGGVLAQTAGKKPNRQCQIRMIESDQDTTTMDQDAATKNILTLGARSNTNQVRKLFIYQWTTNQPPAPAGQPQPKGCYDAGLMRPFNGAERAAYTTYKKVTNPQNGPALP